MSFERKNVFFMFSVFCGFLVFNLIFPPQTDDISFYIENITHPDRGFLHAYLETNGKFGEQIWKFFASKYIHSLWLEILNSLFSTFFVFSFFFLIFARLPKTRLDYYSMFLFLVMVINMCFASTFLWMAGNLNYIWGISFIFAFLIPYRVFWEKILCNSKESEKMVLCKYLCSPPPFILFFLGIMAGWSSETLSLIVSIFILLSIFYARQKKLNLPLWYFIGFLGIVCGWLILFFSPGAAIRAMALDSDHTVPFLERNFVTISEFFKASFFEQIGRINFTFNEACRKSFGFFLLCLSWYYLWKKYGWTRKTLLLGVFLSFLIVIVYFLLKNYCALLLYGCVLFMLIEMTRIDKRFLFFIVIFIAWMVTGLLLVQFKGHVGLRARIGEGLMLSIMLILMFRDFYQQIKYKKFLEKIVVFVFSVSVVANLVNWSYYAYEWQKIVQQVNEAKKNGNLDIVINANQLYSFYVKDFGEIGTNPQSPMNLHYAKYFGVNSFTAK